MPKMNTSQLSHNVEDTGLYLEADKAPPKKSGIVYTKSINGEMKLVAQLSTLYLSARLAPRIRILLNQVNLVRQGLVASIQNNSGVEYNKARMNDAIAQLRQGLEIVLKHTQAETSPNPDVPPSMAILGIKKDEALNVVTIRLGVLFQIKDTSGTSIECLEREVFVEFQEDGDTLDIFENPVYY